MGICVGKYPYCSSQGAIIFGSHIIVTNSHAKSLCFDVEGMLSSHPPIIVVTGTVSSGTGYAGALCVFYPIFSYGSTFLHGRYPPCCSMDSD
ncbi:MAG TPA: hypothetical protein VKA95_07050 [Nitrososphaeraceae archaeon]|nr:hypothetical protein [Nitrososphaeraceae archaeon]